MTHDEGGKDCEHIKLSRPHGVLILLALLSLFLVAVLIRDRAFFNAILFLSILGAAYADTFIHTRYSALTIADDAIHLEKVGGGTLLLHEITSEIKVRRIPTHLYATVAFGGTTSENAELRIRFYLNCYENDVQEVVRSLRNWGPGNASGKSLVLRS